MSPLALGVALLGVVAPLLVAVAVAVWTRYDAAARGSSAPAVWAVLAPLTGIAFAYYLLWWRRNRDRERPPSAPERRAAVVALAGAGGLVGAALAAPPDPVSQALAFPVAAAVCAPVAYLGLDRAWTAGSGPDA